MLASLLTVLPIFALVLTGWLAARFKALGPNATRELNRFVVYLALPSLLFGIMARSKPAEIWQPGFIIAFLVGTGIVFGFVLWLRLRRGEGLAIATVDALSASYPNTGFMGFPLAAALFGDIGLAPTLVAAILTACVLFGFALVLMAIATRQKERSPLSALGSVLKSPLLLAPALGAVVMLSGWPLPEPADDFVTLLGAAASPCALVTLGLFLAQSQGAGASGTGRRIGEIVGLKLIVQPALTFVVAGPLLGLPPHLVALAVVLAGLPTGTGPFMLAELHGQGQRTAAGALLYSTLASVLLLPLLLVVLGV
ncbi:MAG: AEC family transporter [Devosia sp.]